MGNQYSLEHMRERARNAGLLNKLLFAIHTRPVDGGFDAMMAKAPEHVAFQLDLEKRGIMFAAGPLGDLENPDQWHGEGLIVIRADSLEEARDIAASDPMHKSGARTYTVRPWLVNEGTLSVRINFGTGSWRFD